MKYLFGHFLDICPALFSILFIFITTFPNRMFTFKQISLTNIDKFKFIEAQTNFTLKNVNRIFIKGKLAPILTVKIFKIQI